MCVIQRSEPGAEFQCPPYVSGSRTSTRTTTAGAHTGADVDGLSGFIGVRGRLFGIAYRILKDAAEAEDIVQDVWIRWQMTNRNTVRDPAAFLATITMRLAINVIQSAHSRRETNVGSWPWESMDTSADLEMEAGRSEALQSAVFVLLEKLSPAERAAYVLREAFDYSYREIANLLRVREANARQLVTRARQHVADSRHATVNSAEQRSFLAAFVAAAQEGALTALESFFVRITHGPAGKDERAARTGSTVARTNCDAPSWPVLDTAAAA